MGPLTGLEPPCWERPGCLHCWLFTECFCGKPVPTHLKRKDFYSTHPENRRRARMAAESLTWNQLMAIFEQGRDWTSGDKHYEVPTEEEANEMLGLDPPDDDYGCNEVWPPVQSICKDCYMEPNCNQKEAKKYRKETKRQAKRLRKEQKMAEKKRKRRNPKVPKKFVIFQDSWWIFVVMGILIFAAFFFTGLLYVPQLFKGTYLFLAFIAAVVLSLITGLLVNTIVSDVSGEPIIIQQQNLKLKALPEETGETKE